MDEADIVVIGGGAGGLACARRLAESGARVALIEARAAGGKSPGRTDLHARTVPQPGLGGRRGYQPGALRSTGESFSADIAGDARDYDHWAALGCAGWSWREVRPFFAAPRHRGRVVGPVARAFLDAAGAYGASTDGGADAARLDGFSAYPVAAGRAAVWTAARRAGVAMLTEATAERVLFEDGRAWGVAYSRGGEPQVIRTRRAVLAAGAMATSQLLMLSGIGPARHLAELGVAVWLDRPAVGADLQDRIGYAASFERPGEGRRGAWHRPLRAALRRLGVDGFTNDGGTLASGFVRLDVAATVPEIALRLIAADGASASRLACEAVLLRPESRGRIRLASGDARDIPLIDPAALCSERDLATLVAGVRVMDAILKTPAMARLARINTRPIDLADDAALAALVRARADLLGVPAGTARMGSDAGAVCDPSLRVRGAEGLWIADASAMPRIVSGDMRAAGTMIGERCSGFILKD